VSKAPNAELYESDFFEWTQTTAELIRAGQLECVDLEHVAEEIESVGRSDRREVISRLEILIAHLLKWQIQRNNQSRSWKNTINAQRRDLERVLEDSPSLRARLPDWIAKAYPGAKQDAAEEMQLLNNPFPPICPFTPEQITDEGWLPDSDCACGA
jgi:hypothetical protein